MENESSTWNFSAMDPGNFIQNENNTWNLSTMDPDNFIQRENISETGKYSKKTEIFLLLMEYVGAMEYIICFLANALTIASVVKFDYLHKKSTNILILSLSVADGLLGKVSFHF